MLSQPMLQRGIMFCLVHSQLLCRTLLHHSDFFTMTALSSHRLHSRLYFTCRTCI